MKSGIAVVASLLLTGAAWTAAPANAAVPFPPKEGTVFSTHSPPTGGCPALDWHVWVGPNSTLSGVVGLEGMQQIWNVTGKFNSDRSFHLDGKEVGGIGATGTIDGVVRAKDGALIFTIGNLSTRSKCNNTAIWVPWFRHGNAYDPNDVTAGGGG
jgi:hypothetical protein